jgi:hypothetical protein
MDSAGEGLCAPRSNGRAARLGYPKEGARRKVVCVGAPLTVFCMSTSTRDVGVVPALLTHEQDLSTSPVPNNYHSVRSVLRTCNYQKSGSVIDGGNRWFSLMGVREWWIVGHRAEGWFVRFDTVFKCVLIFTPLINQNELTIRISMKKALTSILAG